MERSSPVSASEVSGGTSTQAENDILFPDELWEAEKRNPEFQALYRQIKQFTQVLKERRDVIEAGEGNTFAYATYDNAYKLVSAAYFLLANPDDISSGGRPANAASNASVEFRAEFLTTLGEVINSLGIDPQELHSK